MKLLRAFLFLGVAGNIRMSTGGAFSAENTTAMYEDNFPEIEVGKSPTAIIYSNNGYLYVTNNMSVTVSIIITVTT